MTRPPGEPPRLAMRLVRRSLTEAEAGRLLADLGEEYRDFQRPTRARWRADLWYWQQALSSTRILRRRARAISCIGGAAATGHDVRPVGGGVATLESVLRDIRFALRKLSRAPTFSIAAVLTLALGIGATTAIFSVVNSVLLRSLPYPEPDRIIRAWSHSDDGDTMDFSFRVVEYRRLRERTDEFEAVGAEFPVALTVLLPEQEPRQVQGRMVTADFFNVFGTGPAIGRTFSTGEIAAGDRLLTVVTHEFWTRYLGSDPEAVGRSIDFGGRAFTLIGVLPAGYRHVSGEDAEVFIPYTIGTSGWIGRWFDLYGRLHDDVSIDRAAEVINAVMVGVGEQDHRSAEWHATVEPLHEMIVGDVRPAVLAIFGTVTLVLLIACVNVTNLTLARAITRTSEITVRRALGAGRSRIVRQLLIESLIVALVGGAAGVAVAFAGLRVLISLAPPSVPRVAATGIEPTVLAFALGVTLATGLAFGLAPALDATRGVRDLRSGLRRGARTAGSRGRSSRFGGLVVAEVALALTLLVGAGLMVRTFERLQGEEFGFDRGGALTFRVIVPTGRWPGQERTHAFYRRLHSGLAALPGVISVGSGTDLPLSGEGAVANVNSADRLAAGIREGVTTLQRRATAGYFEALGTPVLAGREFNGTERLDGEPVAIISESLARRLFGGEEAVGRRIGFGNEPDPEELMRVVGVVADIRFRRAERIDEPQIYQAHAQAASRDMAVVVRTSVDPRALLEPAREVLRSIDPEVPLYGATTLQGLVDDALAGRRFTMSLFSVLAAVAVLLTMAGIYGVLAFMVGQRRREIGVRMAMGARAEDVTRLVVREGMMVVAVGLTLGVAGAAAVAHMLRELLYGVSAVDVPTYAAVTVALGLASFVACYLPARRSAGVDPMTVLRQE